VSKLGAATGVSSVCSLSPSLDLKVEAVVPEHIFHLKTRLIYLAIRTHPSFVNDSLPHSIVEEHALQKKNGIRRVSNTHHHHYYSEHGGHYSVRYYSEYGSKGSKGRGYYRIVCKEEVTSEPTENPTSSPITAAPTPCEGRKFYLRKEYPNPNHLGGVVNNKYNKCTNDGYDDGTMYDTIDDCCTANFAGGEECKIVDICNPTSEPTMNPTPAPATAEPTENPTPAPVTPEPTENPTPAPVTPEPTENPTVKHNAQLSPYP